MSAYEKLCGWGNVCSHAQARAEGEPFAGSTGAERPGALVLEGALSGPGSPTYQLCDFGSSPRSGSLRGPIC